MLRCPSCHAALDEDTFIGEALCHACMAPIQSADGIPLLVRDRQVIEATIAEARRQGREAWFSEPQIGQWTGPYRHHVKKRRQWVEEVLAEWSSHHVGHKLNGLDLGCGDGSNLGWLRPHFSRLYGSDYNLLRLMRAARLGIDARLFMADINDYPAMNDSFDVIYFNHVLEHIPDDAAALREVRRILKPGGLLILGVPNEGAAFWQLAYRLQPRVRTTSDHLHHYTADSIAAKCKAAGFFVRRTLPIGWGVPHWTLDAIIRRFKWADDLLESVGRRFMPGQATSLYLLLTK